MCEDSDPIPSVCRNHPCWLQWNYLSCFLMLPSIYNSIFKEVSSGQPVGTGLFHPWFLLCMKTLALMCFL